ncbi:MAG: hypothetical protein H0T18_07315, partial [Chloroflexia bacterium]|nr:hypothetical protein [Chloroflexia bacterium]
LLAHAHLPRGGGDAPPVVGKPHDAGALDGAGGRSAGARQPLDGGFLLHGQRAQGQ